MTQNAGSATPFSQFDVVSDHSDHYYSTSSTKKQKSTGPRPNLIAKEWKILEDNLPDSIYVRVYETRIDLLRAAIVGAAGTPYHDALFFFDICFPTDYPNHPPKVYYRSYGLRVNPNLYASGYVCLSLLNTWNGKKKERWDPSQSSVFQVLLSIQALVLNEKPYYNEPGNGSPGGSEEKSRAYSEQAFLDTCRTTLFSLKNPPKHFKAFTAEHYRERGSRILRACGAYMDGRVGVGYYREDGELESKSACESVSKRFIASMASLYPQLVQGFKKNWTLMEGVLEELKVDKPETTTVKVRVDKKVKKAKIGIAEKIIGKFGKLGKWFGLSKKQNQNMDKSDSKKDQSAGVAVA